MQTPFSRAANYRLFNFKTQLNGTLGAGPGFRNCTLALAGNFRIYTFKLFNPPLGNITLTDSCTRCSHPTGQNEIRRSARESLALAVRCRASLQRQHIDVTSFMFPNVMRRNFAPIEG